MPSLLVLAVAFAGVGGPKATKVEAQVRKILSAETDVVDASLTAKQRHLLVTNGSGAGDLLAKFDEPVMVAGELDKKGKKLTVVVYDKDGSMVDLVEVSVHKHKLDKSSVESLRGTLVPDIERLSEEPKPAKKSKKKKPVEDEPVAQETDDEVPDGERDPDSGRVAAADADDLPGIIHTAEAPHPSAKARESAPRVHIALGFGPRTRTFVPGPAMVSGYQTKPVPSGQLDAAFMPSRFIELDAGVERTIVMESALDSGNVGTSMLRWTVGGALKLPAGGIELAALGGVGSRDFVINAPAPTPNSHYVYAMVGGRLTAHLGKKIAIEGHGAYEPVIGGAQNVTMPSGDASRAGFEVGGGLDIGISQHLVMTAAGGYQRFTWTWDEGTATDAYPSGTLSLGAVY
jgi:hypothetical protein